MKAAVAADSGSTMTANRQQTTNLASPLCFHHCSLHCFEMLKSNCVLNRTLDLLAELGSSSRRSGRRPPRRRRTRSRLARAALEVAVAACRWARPRSKRTLSRSSARRRNSQETMCARTQLLSTREFTRWVLRRSCRLVLDKQLALGLALRALRPLPRRSNTQSSCLLLLS